MRPSLRPSFFVALPLVCAVALTTAACVYDPGYYGYDAYGAGYGAPYSPYYYYPQYAYGPAVGSFSFFYGQSWGRGGGCCRGGWGRGWH